MNTELEQIIKYNSEGSNLDYKKEEYVLGKSEKKNEILKDISAFANHHSDSDKYIIIGVKEKDGVASEFYEIESLTDEATYQQFLFDNIEPKINFEYKSATFKEKQIAYFRIFGNKNRPYLFKKNLQNPVTKKPEYKIGDGFIKVGSSSRKLDRNDFESIYKTRFTERDRKNDLKIETYFGTTDNDEIINLDIKYIDIKITNQSNKSIEFDIEMKVFKSDKYGLISEDELIKELKKNQKKKSNGFGIDFEVIQPQIMNLHVDFNEKEDFVIISRNSLAKKTAINLAQNSSESDIFCKHLFVLGGNADEIKAELTIRSDDFTEGSLIQELTFKK
ncbi:AlbA family DNA-binding domain-containing protein [Tenacibaculum discolor]|uniref:AlbA family DNA-binding domain-containing protein n=1 Tax=Tenacibaculum discolor TaxID=361581 RepID=UPI003F7A890E